MTNSSNAVLSAVEATARTHAHAPAYRDVDGVVTDYATLWDTACRIAGELCKRTSGNDPILVVGDKHAITVASFLSCLLSGHPFIPLDSDLPAARVRDIASQLPAATLLAASPVPTCWADALPECVFLDAQELAKHTSGSIPDRNRWVSGDDTYYIIFTSGSTGRPKGIEVAERNISAFMSWVDSFPIVQEGGKRFLDQAHYSFDLSEYSLIGALSTGGCLCAVNFDKKLDFVQLFSGLRESNIDIWVSTPSFADICLADPSFCVELMPNAKMFLFCGEELHQSTAQKLTERFPDAIIANTYGPTESTVAVTYTEIGRDELAGSQPLPVGQARPGTEIRIVDADTRHQLPIGSTGEIVICGDTVAKGYYADPEKTAAAFFDTTLFDGTPTRAYRTGDMGHVDENGMLHCEGRIDSLVKVNGFRIELSEVEGALTALPSVAQAAVMPHASRGRFNSLTAFVVIDRESFACANGAMPSDSDIARELKRALAFTLPAYMVPRRFRFLETLPLTANEKVDRRALESLR